MHIYTVHQRSSEFDVEFVRDGWSWPAFWFGPFWLAFHRLWRELAGFLAILIAIILLFDLLGADDAVLMSALLLLPIGLAVAGNDLRRAAMSRRGYQESGLVSGETLEDCEDRYLGRSTTRDGTAPVAGVPI